MIKVPEGRRAIKRLIEHIRESCPENTDLMEDCDKLDTWFKGHGGYPEADNQLRSSDPSGPTSRQMLDAISELSKLV